MVQAPMLSSPLKQTNEIDWIQPLKQYIRTTYGDDPERYTEECATLNRLRQDIRGAGKDSAAGRDLLYRYYGQLELLDLRFPVDENHIKISFTWFDAFTAKPTSQYSLAFEKASIIFNISAVLSCHAANQNRSEESGLKTAYHSFQASAGMFTYINENFLHAPSVDLSRETVKTLISITLAQAQEIFLEKQIADGKKAGLLAKLAAQADVLYLQSIEGCQENVGKGIFDRSWSLVIQAKAAHMASLAEYYQAMAEKDGYSYGTAIARLQLAEKSSKTACSFAKSVPSSPSADSNLGSEAGPALVQITKRQLENVQEKLAALIKDNDFVYHQTVPTEASLAAVSKLPAAKAIPVSELYQGQDIQKIIGPDIFQRLVPISVTEQASMYDEEKAKLVRSEAEKVEIANGEMEASLDYLKLPQSLKVLKGGLDEEITVEDEFKRWCEDLAGHESFSIAFEQLRKLKSNILSSLSQNTKQLDMEESVCEKMRSKYGADWTQQPSSRLTSIFRSDIRNYRDTIDEAANTDSQLFATARQYEKDFEEMRSAGEADESDVLFQRALINSGAGKVKNKNRAGVEGNLLEEDYGEGGPTVADQIARVEELLKKLSLVKRERGQVLKDLKEKVLTDDISNVLILNKKSILNQENHLFQAELEKYRSHQNRLLSTVHKQQSLLKELTKTYGDLLQDKRVRSDQLKYEAMTRGRTAVMSRYGKVYQVFEDLREGLQRAERFYGEMKETVDSIGKNVEGFVNNRRAEGAQLLSQIEQNKASSASSQAAAERERLQQLMERMSMDPSTASSGATDSRPPPPLSSRRSYPTSRSPPISPQYQVVNPDPRFTIPPQEAPRPVETQPYHQPIHPNGYQHPLQHPLTVITPAQQPQPQPQHQHQQQQQQQQQHQQHQQHHQQHQQQQHAFSQGAAAPISEGYHPMAYPYQTSISPHPPQGHQFFPPISTTPQPGTFYPRHQSPAPPQSSYQSPSGQYQQHGRFPSNPGIIGGVGGGAAAGGGAAYVPPPPPGPPPGSMTNYPPTQGPLPSGPGGYAQAGRPGAGQQGAGKQQTPQPQQNQGQADPWAGLNAWR